MSVLVITVYKYGLFLHKMNLWGPRYDPDFFLASIKNYYFQVGTVYGTLLGMEEYIPKYRSGNEGVIVNISSIAGLDSYCSIPVYTGTKFAVQGISRSFGDKHHYERTKVKVITICPGVTKTNLISDIAGKTLGPAYENLMMSILSGEPTQK